MRQLYKNLFIHVWNVFVGVGRVAPDKERLVLLKPIVHFSYAYGVLRGLLSNYLKIFPFNLIVLQEVLLLTGISDGRGHQNANSTKLWIFSLLSRSENNLKNMSYLLLGIYYSSFLCIGKISFPMGKISETNNSIALLIK